MSETASERAIRLLDMVPFLNAHPGISIKELASAFSISTNQLIADLNLLFLCGLPGYTPLELIDLSFDDGFVVIKEPQNLADPRNLTDRELLYLLIGLSSLESELNGEKLEKVKKLRAKLRISTKSSIPLGVVDASGSKSDLATLLSIINESLEKRKKLRVEYRHKTRDSISERELSPYRIVEQNKKFYLEAFSHDVNEIRTFNLENINRAKVLNEDCVELDEVKATKSETVQFESEPDSIFFPENSAKITKAGSIFKIDVFQREWIVRNALRDGGAMTITAPKELRIDVKNLAKSALANYQK